MRAVNRRELIARVLGVGAVPLLAIGAQRVFAQTPEPQVVKIIAKRFDYTPREFHVKAGRPVVLEFTSIDFVHGFSMPELNVRTDLPPGTVTRLSIPPAKAGIYDFLCDNFCGDGHEEMHGRMIVDA
jgi:cytochrome c oxidase subunit II